MACQDLGPGRRENRIGLKKGNRDIADFESKVHRRWNKEEKMRKKAILGLALVACALIFSTAAGAQVTLVTSRWAGPYADFQADLLKRFTAETGIVVKPDAIDYGQLYQKQVMNMSAKTGGYDLIYTQEVWTPNYVKSKFLLPLSDYFKTVPGFDIDSYVKSMVQIDTFGGKVYALPDFTQCAIVAYDKEKLAAAGFGVPQTWDDILKVAKYFKEQGTGIAIPAMQGMAAVDIWAALAYSDDGGYFDARGKLDMASAANVETMEFWKQLAGYSMEGSANWHFDDANKALQFGQAPIAITVSGLANQLEDATNSKVAGKVGFVPLPYKKNVAVIMSLWSWAIPADSKHPKEAFRLLAWLTSDPIAKETFAAIGSIPGKAKLFNDPDLTSKYSFVPAVGKALAGARTQPLLDNSTKLTDALAEALSAVTAGTAQPKEALEKIQKDMAKLF
jgi:ABC-type glycerol-3-phosphate transport system substrate-binding protein